MYKRLEHVPDKALLALAAAMSLLIGILARLPYLFPEDPFPLGDGGLFVEMINAIKANHYLLPEYVTYNRVQIPFAYPPLGFYLSIAASRIFGLSTLTVARYLPLVFNLLTILAFVALAFELVKDKPAFFISAAIFPIALHVYLWTIKGGGIARSPGFFFTTLALYLVSAYDRQPRGLTLLAGIFALGAALLSHPEWALVAPVSLSVLILFSSRRDWRQRARVLFVLFGGAFLLTSPWWLTIILRFGMTPLRMAGQVGRTDPSQILAGILEGRMLLTRVTLTQDFYLPFFGLIGVAFALYRKNFLLPGWLAAAYLASPKNAPIPGIIPLILLIAIGLRGVDELLVRGLQALKNKYLIIALSFLPLSGVYLLVVLLLGLFSLMQQPVLRPIKQSDRAAMQFVVEKTPRDAQFVVLAPQAWFEADAVEWFPLLADRQSLTTPQGLEWVSSSEFLEICADTFETSTLVRLAAEGRNSDSIVKYVEDHFADYDYVAVFDNNLEENFGGFLRTGEYELVYFKRSVLIFHKTR